MTGHTDHAEIIAGDFNPRVARVFGFIARRMIAKRFNALRVTPGSLDALAEANDHDGPVVVCLTHSSWWDPMVGFFLHNRCLRDRQCLAPIDKDVLANLGIFKTLGLFGIDPDDPASHEAMRRYVIDRFTSMAKPTLWITPEGRFRDPRDRMEIRPGVSTILSKLQNTRAYAVAAEYVFWDDQKPEMLVHLLPVTTPDDPSRTTAWHRSVCRAMLDATEELAELAIARDPAAFDIILGSGAGRTFFVYDWYLRLTGRSTEAIRTRRSSS